MLENLPGQLFEFLQRAGPKIDLLVDQQKTKLILWQRSGSVLDHKFMNRPTSVRHSCFLSYPSYLTNKAEDASYRALAKTYPGGEGCCK